MPRKRTKPEITIHDADLQQALDNIDEVFQEKAQTSFRHFFPFYWEAYSGARLKMNWHLDVMCEHIQHAYNGEIKRLIFTVPPRSTKSSAVSISSPAWKWISNPETQFLCGSHSLKLVTQNITACRRIIDSPKYKGRYCTPTSAHFKFQLTSDQNTKTKIDTTFGGRLAGVSPDTKALGEGFNIGLLDDLLDYSDLNSLTAVDDINSWMSNLFFGRSNDKSNDVIVLIMQRLKEGDPVDYVKDKFKEQNWLHINIPATYNPEKTYFTPLGDRWKDPRKPGELIDVSGRICTQAFLDGLDPIIRQVQYEQDVSAMTTGVGVEEADVRFVTQLPARFEAVITVWDLTFSATAASKSWNVGTVVGRYNDNFYIFDSIRGKFEIPDQIAAVKTLAAKYKQSTIGIEEKANGAAVMQFLKKEFPGIIPFKTNEWGGTKVADKEKRFSAAVPYWKAKQVYIYKPLIPDLRLDATYDPQAIAKEITGFPLASTDEYVDTTSYAIPWLAESGGTTEIIIWGSSPIVITEMDKWNYSPEGMRKNAQMDYDSANNYASIFTDDGQIPSWDDCKNLGF